MSDHPTAPGRSGVDGRRDAAPDGTDTGRRAGGLGRPVDAPPGSRSRPPVPPLRPVPTGPRTTMAPFQAAVPGADAPGARDDLWSSSRPGRGQRVADRRAADQREAQRLEAERQEAAARDEAERREAERLAVEQRAAQQREAERREAGRREAERRESERQESERRESERHAAAARAAEARARQRAAAAPSESGPAPRGDDDRSAPWSTGPAGSRPGPPGGPRPAGAGPAAGAPAYGDWTRPSRSGEDTGPGRRAVDPEEDYNSQRFARLRAGAPTDVTGASEEAVAPRRRRADEDRPRSRGDHDDEPAGRDRGPSAVRGPATGPASVSGGRAAERAERRAAEEERKKAAKSARAADRAAGVRRGGAPRRAVLGLVAVAVVALTVLGVYSFASPHTLQAASQTPATKTAGDTAALGSVPGVSDLPPLSTVPAPTSAGPTTPVRVPVTVLNSTDITGLAASIAGKIHGGGWQTLQVGAYQNKDVAATTVYFTQGNEQQRQAALQLIAQFPQLHGPAARFFNVPPAAAGGLVVVATGDWKP